MAALAAPSPAAPEAAAEANEPLREGMYATITPYAGYGMMFYHYGAPSASMGRPGSSRPPRAPLAMNAELYGPHFDLTVGMGHALRPSLALAFDAAFWNQLVSVQSESIEWTSISNALGAGAGLALDYWPRRTGPLHVRFGLAAAFAAFFFSTLDIGTPDNVVEPEIAYGPLSTVATEYDFVRRRTIFFGLAARLHGGLFASEHSLVVPLGATLGIALGGF